jgi:hypothetical protein
LFAKSLTLDQVHQHRLGQERLRLTILGPFKLVVALREVLDQVFHPEQRGVPVSHCVYVPYVVCLVEKALPEGRHFVGRPWQLDKAKAVPMLRDRPPRMLEIALAAELEKKCVIRSLRDLESTGCNPYMTRRASKRRFLFASGRCRVRV